MRISLLCLAVIAAGSMALVGCSTAPKTPQERQALDTDSKAALNNLTAQDPRISTVLKNSAGYAIFPAVGSGAVGIGGSYGQGEVWEGGRQSGFADMTSATIGASFGGQTYVELIIFRTPEALARFKAGGFAFDSTASAVAIKTGAAAQVQWTNDVAVIIDPKSGLMADASIGGQKFNYTALTQ